MKIIKCIDATISPLQIVFIYYMVFSSTNVPGNLTWKNHCITFIYFKPQNKYIMYTSDH